MQSQATAALGGETAPRPHDAAGSDGDDEFLGGAGRASGAGDSVGASGGDEDVRTDTQRRLERLSQRAERLVAACEETRLAAAMAASALMRTATSPLRTAEYEEAMSALEEGLWVMEMEDDAALDRRVEQLMRRGIADMQIDA